MRFFRATEGNGVCNEGDIFVVSGKEKPILGELVLMTNGIQRYADHLRGVIGVVIEIRRGISREPIYRRPMVAMG